MSTPIPVGSEPTVKDRFWVGFAAGMGTMAVLAVGAVVALGVFFVRPELAINVTVAETVRPLVEGVEEDLESVIEDIEENAEGQGERRDTEHLLTTKARDGKAIPVPIEQLKAVHQIWLDFGSILGAADQDKFDSLLDLLKPLDKRLAAVVFGEWETLIYKDGQANNGK